MHIKTKKTDKIPLFQYIDPRTIPEVKPTCQPRRCYFVCRMKNLGGGRCTKGGCMCYAGFFAYDGSPLTRQYQEDDIWFDLTSDEQTKIKTNMARWRYVFNIKLEICRKKDLKLVEFQN